MSDNQKKKIIFYGLGSIGLRLLTLIQRHYDCHLFAFRRANTGKKIIGVNEIYDTKELEKLKPDIAFITNPTSMHVATAIDCARQGMHLFIEKPLGNTLGGYGKLVKAVTKNRTLSYVACNLRFHPVVQYLKYKLNFDDFFYARVTCSSFLPDWRPGKDYRNTYSAKNDLGGGVILDLIHEVDYCSWLFGPIKKVTGNYGKISNLEIETEDLADITLHHTNGFMSHLHLDYFSRIPQRTIDIFGHHATVHGDLLNPSVTLKNGKAEDIKQFPTIDANDTYLAELVYFFSCIQDGIEPMNNIHEHISILLPVLEFKLQHHVDTKNNDKKQLYTWSDLCPGRL